MSRGDPLISMGLAFKFRYRDPAEGELIRSSFGLLDLDRQKTDSAIVAAMDRIAAATLQPRGAPIGTFIERPIFSNVGDH
ncbi:hypothetical protein MKK64_26690 [Methylobacterium sp. E-025]|uniref:hypothetical protein n=1 Tax=Methylobacterium sp. E-025 TaxID=2836561 RepID=UPI001FB93032|nr:hypothetical protein [Methylobacterium sp. E-025]MCJ2114754.1 hypothetical protein [Methylobacterium sp. E-025]